MSRFEPVWLPEGRELNNKMSQTFLRHFNWCPRSAYLYAYFKGDASTDRMQRGSAAHEMFERATAAMIATDNATVPAEVVKAELEAVLHEYNVAFEEHDYIREMAWRWANDFTIEPGAPQEVERLFVLNVGGVDVRAKIDFAQLLENGRRLEVIDYKTGRGAPAYEDIARKRPDGTYAAKAFQLVLYALVAVFGQPIREEWHLGERVEIVEPLPFAPLAEEIHMEFVFPGIKSVGQDGQERMLRRPVTLTRRELEEYRQSLDSLVARVLRAEAEGDWEAIVTDAGCGECPASVLCPIPKELRDHRGTINTLEEAVEAVTKVDRDRAILNAINREVKAFAKGHNLEIPMGRDKVFMFVTETSERIDDREGMFAAMQEYATYGTPKFERSDWVKEVKSTTFRAVKLSEDEIAARAAESEGSDGSSD